MNFKPKSDEQLAKEAAERAASRLLPEGIYPFETTKSADETSKKGNPMIHLGLTVFFGDQRIALDDYLLEQMEFRLKHYCATTGLLDLYQQGALHALDCMGKQGWVKIGIEKGRAKDNGSGFFPDKNRVLDYAPEPVKTGEVRREPTEEEMANLDPLADPDNKPF